MSQTPLRAMRKTGSCALILKLPIQGHGVYLKNGKVDALEAGKMGKSKDLSEFGKGQIVMARRLDQSISKTAALVECSQSAVVSIYQKWSKEGTVVNR
ncbi:hypothetical protein QTP70_012850 [Hemibagrus guttatus]|uniref:Uncharacterized protein n=1 Tax=Hemibagrus guttatus TaxID=175788 RepID=A0AAE0QQ36_9TELE|nr:hypothetical protein QTP70_012850 [Hemibagrus guttatus]